MSRWIDTRRVTATKIVRVEDLQVTSVGQGGPLRDVQQIEGGAFR